MSTPILATKLYLPPPRPKVVLRPQLIERLNEGLRRAPSVSLISASAGFGKTTLVSEWIADCERPAAWLSLDEGDNDLTRFLTYLVAALQTLALSKVEGIASRIGEGVLGMLGSPQPPPPEAILTALLNEITTIRDIFILVLDDYHVIDAKPIDQALAFLLEHLPPRMHLILATREDPDVPLSRLRVQGRLTELRAADLRFSPSEAADFFNRVMGLNLSAADIAALETRTEGWVAGLHLAAISLQGHQDAAGFIRSFTGSHRFVMDYLLEEVLQQQSESVQTFLLRTSILDRLCGSLCDAVLLDPSAAGREILEYLERANLLVIPLDDQREWYRYHHLFADVLRARLRKEQPDQVADLHLRACAWWEKNNFRPEAIHHAVAAEDFERAADLIELEWSAKSGTYFRSATWLGWVKALPDELVRTRPRLSIGLAWELLFSGELEAAEARLKDADRWLEPTTNPDASWEATATTMVAVPEDRYQSLRASLAIARAFHAQARGDVVGTESHARRALSLVSETNDFMRGLAAAQLGLACWTKGDLASAHAYIAEAMARLRTAGNVLFANSGASVLADIRVAQGRLLDAIDTYEQALQLAAAQGETVLQGTADLYLGLGELHRERGNVAAARQHLRRAEELGQQAALPDWPHDLYLAQARIREDQGDLDGALRLLEDAARLYHRSPVPVVRPVAALKARVWIGQGRLTEALDWAHQRGLSVADDLTYLREFEHLTLARALIARYRRDQEERSIHEAHGLLERLLRAAEEGGRMGSIIEILVLQALAHAAQGNLPPALVPLERALTLAEPEGYVRTIVDEGPPMAELLTELSASREGGKLGRRRPRSWRDVQPRYVAKLLAALQKREEVQSSALRPPPLAEPLSQREVEVLQLIAQGLSNQEIGQRLFLALSTVKGYNHRIFGKLQVQRRTEAVARARELGLLKPER